MAGCPPAAGDHRRRARRDHDDFRADGGGRLSRGETLSWSRRVGKAQRAHHLAPNSIIDGGHVASLLYPPYRTEPAPHFPDPAAASTGDQRVICSRTKRSKIAGLRSSFGGTAPPSCAIRSRTWSSSSARSSASESRAMISGETPFGATSPAQTLIS